jgi:NTE family protein
VHALTLLIEQRLTQDVAAFAEHVELFVAPPLCPLRISSADFRHAGQLVARARQSTNAWFASGMHRLRHPERFLSLHTHPAATPATTPTHGGHAA